MASDFDKLERQFQEALLEVSEKCSSLVSGSSGAKRQQHWARVSSLLQEADSLIRSMDLEARTDSAGERAGLLGRLREKKMELNAAKRIFRSLPPEPVGLDGDLSDVEAAEDAKAAAEQRAKLLSSTGQLSRASGRIEDSRKALLQTEAIGVSILQDLHQQRHTLIRAHETLVEVDEDVSLSRRILRVMTLKMHRNKWISGLILLILFAAIALVIYLKLQ